MKVLWVATYPYLGASSRYRICQFLPALEQMGVKSTFIPFFSNEFFKGFYNPGNKLQKGLGLIAASLRRLADAPIAKDADVIVVQREAAIVGPPVFEMMAKRVFSRPIVFDVDDPIFAPSVAWTKTGEVTKHYGFARLLKDQKKPDRIARMSSEIIVANEFTEEWARRYTDRVTVIPTVVDGNHFRPDPEKNNTVPVVGWVGSYSAASQLDMVKPALERLAKKHRFEVKIVGASPREIRVEGVKVHNVDWSLEREVEDFRSLDIGLAPMFDDEWSKGKPGFKSTIYMASGVPQVASPVGTLPRFMSHGDQGYFARSGDEWFTALDSLLSDAALRKKMAARARATFETGPTLQNSTPVLYEILRRAAASP